jgi:cell pole-organizing protein PopZ
VTAEPRMEELLASIRKAIHDDIGEIPASTSAEASGSLYKGSTRELHVRVGEAAGTAAAEIQQLRDKINRGRAGDAALRQAPYRSLPPAPETVPPVRPRYHEPPRRSWRDLNPPPPLRPTLAEPEDVEAVPHRPASYERRESFAEQSADEPQAWHQEPSSALAPVRDRRQASEPGMLSGDTAEAVQAAFNRLAESMFSRAAGERSIEELTREMLRGMLKQWLDDNLPALVERLVREEIERVARRGH